MPLPPPPNPARLDPLVIRRDPGTLFRVHRASRGSATFNPGLGDPSRFAPLRDGARMVPTMYAAETVDAALSESVFHDVPVRGPGKRIIVARLSGMVLSPIAVDDPLDLVDLAGPGLTRLGLRRAELIDTGRGAYPDTVRWALALHDCPRAPAGITWMSRHDDRARATLIFGDRVKPLAFSLRTPVPIPLWTGDGLDLVLDFADRAGIDVIR